MTELVDNVRRLLERARAAAAALSLGPVDLRTGELDDDPQDSLPTEGSTLVFDYYTLPGLRRAFERYGFMDRVRHRGYQNLQLKEVERGGDDSMLRLTAQHATSGREHVLMELIARRSEMELDHGTREVLYVDWALLQDPERSFTDERPQLPGQDYPGLGVGLLLEEMMRQVCLRLSFSGVVDRPAGYHNRLLGRGVFLDPEIEGRFQILRVHLAKLTLAEASFALADGRVRTRSGKPVFWEPGVRLLAADKHAFATLEDPARMKAVHAAEERWAAELAGVPLK